MKKILIITFIMAFTALQAGSFTYEGNATGFKLICDENMRKINEPGCPELPYLEVELLLPFGCIAENTSFSITGDIQTVKGIYLPSASLPASFSAGKADFPSREDIYKTDAMYPGIDYKYMGTQRLSGYDIARFLVYPYQYNPVRNVVTTVEQFELHVDYVYDAKTAVTQQKYLTTSANTQKRLRNLIENEDMTATYPEPVSHLNTRLVDPSDPAQLLIICGEEYLDIYDGYEEFRETHGITTAIYPIEDILLNITTEEDDAANLRAFIKEAYLAWGDSQSPLEYVILGGDDEIIPYRGCWGTNYYYGTVYDMPSDVYFGNLDGDWNANGNEYYGEYDDDVDLLSEVSVGRFPGDDPEEIQNQCNKIIDYVQYPSEYLDSMLLIGELLNDTPMWGGDFLDDLCDNENAFPQYYNKTRLYDRDNTFSTDAVTAHINSSSSFMMHHCAHTHYWYLFGLDQYQMDNFTNTTYPYFFCGGCYNIAFDQPTSGIMESVGEHAVTDNKGMMGFLGNSRYGFTTYLEYLEVMFSAIYFDNCESFGHGLTAARDEFSSQAAYNDIVRYEYFEMTNCCDPSLHLISGEGLYPSIHITESIATELSGNGNNIFETGEEFEIVVSGYLAEDHNSAAGVEFRVCSDENISPIAGESSYDVILNGDTFTNEDQPFVIEIDQDVYSPTLNLKFEASAYEGFDFYYRKKFDIETEPTTGINNDDNIICNTEINGIYPNPFNPETMITFSTADENAPAEVKIFNIKGQKVRTLIDESLPAGEHRITWNGNTDQGKPVASGIYLCILRLGEVVTSKRIMLVK